MIELMIPLEQAGGRHLYDQIYEYIKNEIKKGKLLSNERLPSTRLLAQNLQISRSTVDLAYEQLAAEGYIESRPCKGYFVCKVEELYHLDQKEPRSLPGPSIVPEFQYDFSPNKIDVNHFPMSTWKRISKTVLMDNQENILESGPQKGEYNLRETICHYLHASRGVECDSEQLIIGAGNDYLLLLLQRMFGSGLIMAIENPTYRRAYQIFSTSGCKMQTVGLDESGMNVSELEKSGANIAYVMPAHQFPTGIVMPIGRRMELLNWAGMSEDRFIIEDDYDSEFRYKGKPIPSLQASDHKGKVIYIGTFSKSIAPAIRVSYMVLPKALLPVYEATCSFISCTVPRVDQAVLNEFIRGGHFERYLNKMRKVYRMKHDLVMEELKRLKDYFEIRGEYGGLHVLLKCHPQSGLCVEEILEKASTQGIRLYGMSAYYVGEQSGENAILLGYGGLREDEIINGIQALRTILKGI